MRKRVSLLLLACTFAIASCSKLPQQASVPKEPYLAGPGVNFETQSVTQEVGKIDWLRQFGASSSNFAHACVSNSEGVFILGEFFGGPTETNQTGITGAFIRKYSFVGAVEWTIPVGINNNIAIHDLGIDDTGLYVVGESNSDAVLIKYDLQGDLVWSRVFGTTGFDIPTCITLDGQAIYVAGNTDGVFSDQAGPDAKDAFVCKLDLDGNVVWAQQIPGEADQYPEDISVSSQGISVVGETYGAVNGESYLGARDAFIWQLDTDGVTKWVDLIGTELGSDIAKGVLSTPEGIYVLGTNSLPLSEPAFGNYDIFIGKYTSEGMLSWIKHLGTETSDQGLGIASYGNEIYIAGHLGKFVFEGPSFFNYTEAFISRIDEEANVLWTAKASEFDRTSITTAVTAGPGGIFGVGITTGTLPGQVKSSESDFDIFAMKVSPKPNEQPMVTCPDDIVVEAMAATGAVVSLPTVSASDPDGGEVSVLLSQNGQAPFGLGTTSVHVTAMDDEESKATCAFDVTVQDTVAPTITCPPAQTFTTSNPNGTALTLPLATATDTVDSAVNVQTVGAPATFPWGTTFVTSRATDDSGNFSTCQFPVTVKLLVPVDVMPGTFPNRLNRTSKGTLPVAVLSTTNFDATQIDPGTVRLAGASVATKPKGIFQATQRDLNGDGRLDWLFQFNYNALQINSNTTQVVLTGQTFAGKPIEGTDAVQVIK